MSAQQIEGSDVVAGQGESLNEVRLIGRLGADPQQRELPSGDVLWTLRVVVDRPPPPPGKETARRQVDAVECAVWSKRLQRSVAKRHEGDVVEVVGALRRRFFRAGAAKASRFEVELERFRLIRRAGSG